MTATATKYRLVISDTVEFPVEFALKDAGRTRTFAFTLIGRRVDQAQLDADRDEGMTVGQVLEKNLTDWRGQTLVVDDETGQPAEFGPEPLRVMLAQRGVTVVVLNAYLAALDAKGKEKN